MADEGKEVTQGHPAGFARTPYPLTYGGPQMEDYPDWDSWYFARQEWVMRRMLANARARGEAEKGGG